MGATPVGGFGRNADAINYSGDGETVEMEKLAVEFLDTGALPATARSDAIHLAVATLAQTDYLLTWNCRHLANAQILRRMEREALRFGWKLPTVCTPLELMGAAGMKTSPILEEVWRVKDELSREAGHDIHRLCANTRKWAAEHPHPGPVIRNAEELRRFLADEKRKHAEASVILKEEPPESAS